VYFDNIDSKSVKLGVYLYTEIIDYDEFLEFKTKINSINNPKKDIHLLSIFNKYYYLSTIYYSPIMPLFITTI